MFPQPAAKRARSPGDALGEAVRTSLGALPHYSRYSATRSEALAADDPVAQHLASSFTSAVTRHRGPGPNDPHRSQPIFEVQRVEKIYSPRLQEAYLAELQNVAGLCRSAAGQCRVQRIEADAVRVQSFEGIELNEFLLFHGTPSSMVERLTQQGLDPRNAGTNFGKLFGHGTYLASHSSKSDIYTKPNAAGERCVLVVRACLGEAHYEKTGAALNWLKPPERPDGRGPLSSLVAVTRDRGGCVEHPEYIVYKETQTLPQFTIWYKHAESCHWCAPACLLRARPRRQVRAVSY